MITLKNSLVRPVLPTKDIEVEIILQVLKVAAAVAAVALVLTVLMEGDHLLQLELTVVPEYQVI